MTTDKSPGVQIIENVQKLQDFTSITLLLSLKCGNTYEKLKKISEFINSNMKINGITWNKLSIVPCNKNPYNFALKIQSAINENFISISKLISILTIHKSIRLDVISLETCN